MYAHTVGNREVTDLVVVIPTFNPPTELTNNPLIELVATISASGYPVIISDDASTCTHDPVLRALLPLPHVTVIRHARNKGIARGLNDGLREAQELGATWLLTVDQDSRIDSNYIPRILEIAKQKTEVAAASNLKLGALAPQTIHDSSGSITYPTKVIGSLTVTEEVIQSGTLWNVAALTQVGGFDEKLAIDAVDAAACLRLREAGYVIALTPDVTFGHTLGDARQVKFLGRTVVVTGHTPKRRASIVRNRLRLAPAEFKQSPQHAMRTLRRVGVNELLGWALPKPKDDEKSRNSN